MLMLPGATSGAAAPGWAKVHDVRGKIGHPWRLDPGHPSLDARSAGQSINMLWQNSASTGGGNGHPWPLAVDATTLVCWLHPTRQRLGPNLYTPPAQTSKRKAVGEQVGILETGKGLGAQAGHHVFHHGVIHQKITQLQPPAIGGAFAITRPQAQVRPGGFFHASPRRRVERSRPSRLSTPRMPCLP